MRKNRSIIIRSKEDVKKLMNSVTKYEFNYMYDIQNPTPEMIWKNRKYINLKNSEIWRTND